MPDSAALARHVIDRLGYGPRAGDLDRIESMAVDRWIEQQLNPASLSLPAGLTDRLASCPTLKLSPPQIFLAYGPPSVRPPGGGRLDDEQRKEENRRAQFVAFEAAETRLLRATESPRQLEEVLVDFWFNHFNVFVGKGLDRLWIGAYEEEAIRPHVLGRFRDLLGATAKHPAMLFFLDNWQNTAPGSPGAKGQFQGLNENYAREVMELHTLGVNGGYTQDDVIALAKILTGWTIGPVQRPRPPRPAAFFGLPRRFARDGRPPQKTRVEGRGTFVFDEDRHDFSDKVFLGQRIHGSGSAEGEQALDTLARSPATARHVSYQLAQYFLADNPDNSIVAAMAKTFQSSDGNIRAVLRTLFASEAFRSPAAFGTKFKTPYRYVVSAVRAAGVPVRNFRPLLGTLAQLGQPLHGCQTPDGYKNTQEAWLNPDAMTRRVSFAVALAQGHLPLDTVPDESAPIPMSVERRMEAGMPQRASERPPPAPGPVVDPAMLAATLGNQFSETTRSAIEEAPPELRAAMALGSPEFMRC